MNVDQMTKKLDKLYKHFNKVLSKEDRDKLAELVELEYDLTMEETG